MTTFRLRLDITGSTSQSQRAIDNLKAICDAELPGVYEVEVIDVLEYPALAENEKILATPTLVKRLPEPVRKIIGDLSDREKVLLGLDLETMSRSVAP
jgi:circadian clock protein KaiB